MREPAAPPPPAARPTAGWLDALLLGTAALAALVLLRQRAFHGMDAQHLIRLVRAGETSYYSHPLFLPLVVRWHALWSSWTDSPFQTLRAASMVGVACGTFAVHRAGLALGLSRARAALAAALTFAAPAVTFFGTVVEIHGVFFAFLGLAFLAWARNEAVPSPARGAVLGACTGIAAGVHSSGHFVVPLLLALTVGRRPERPRAVAASVAVAWAVHAAVTLLIARVVAAPPAGGIAATLDYILPTLARTPAAIARLLWQEWLEPFLPLSATTFLALAARRTRRAAVALLLGTVPLLVLMWMGLSANLYERGAYLIPFAWPAAVLLVSWWPGPAAAGALALSLVLSVAQIVRHDRLVEDPALSTGVRAIAAAGPVFVVCRDVAELEQLQRDVPAADAWPLLDLTRDLASGYDAATAAFDRHLAAPFAAGRTVLMTDSAFALLRDVPLPDVQRFRGEHLPGHYELLPLAERGFAGFEVRRRERTR